MLPRRLEFIVILMKAVLTVLVVLLQLRPVLGSAVCLHAAAHPQQECQMPGHGGHPASALSEGGAAQDCALGKACAPSTLVIPRSAETVSFIPLLNRAPAALVVLLRPGDSVAPPLPPPIV